VALLFLYGTNTKDSVFGDIIFFFLISFLLLLWVGLVRFVFKEKELMVDMYHSVLVFFTLLFSLMFGTFTSAFFAGLCIGMLTYEYLTIHKFSWKPRMMLASIALGLLTYEMLLIVQILPLHVIALAGVVSLFTLVVRNLYVAHFSGTLSQHFLFQNIVIFITLCVVLFATGKWVI